MLKLAVFNPSDYPRGGFVTIPWQSIHSRLNISPDELILYDEESGKQIPFQVDYIDPINPSLNTLIFSLPHVIPPGGDISPSFIVSVERGRSILNNSNNLKLDIISGQNSYDQGIKLINNRLNIFFNLIPGSPTGNNKSNWYAGAATSVQLNNKEMLDRYQAEIDPMRQDPENRCMQIDKIQLCHPISGLQEINMFNRHYRILSQNVGPISANITIASDPFDYVFLDTLTSNKCHLVCQLYRSISLYAYADYLIEELFLKGKLKGKHGEEIKNQQVVNLNFTAHYFTYMNVGKSPHIYQLNTVHDWFAAGDPEGFSLSLHPGYGFATNAHTGLIIHPQINYPHASNNYKTFSWQLLPTQYAKNLHLFMDDHPGRFDARIGQYWYEYIYKPIWAEVR